MTHDVLGSEDAAWLHMEDASNPMVVNGVLQLAARLPIDRAHELLARLAAIPRFRTRVVEPTLRVGRPSWKDAEDFDLSHHVEHVELDSPNEADLLGFIGHAVSSLLDKAQPLWRVYLIDRPGAGTTILFRIHHSIADGFALLGVLLSLCDEGAAKRDWTTAKPPRAHRANVLGAARALGRVIALPSDPKTLLKGALGPEKRVAWSEPLPLAAVKEAAHIAGATVNDVLVATAAGALRRYLARHGESAAGLELHAMVPVNLRPSAAMKTLGNRFGLVVLGLPIGIADPLDRVAAVKMRMKELKGTPEAFVTYGLLRAMGRAPRRLEDAAVSFFGKKTSLVLTNVPGPRSALSLAGVDVSRIMFWVPQSGRLGLGLSIFSYAGEVTIGIISDASLVPDPQALASDIQAEYAALRALMRGDRRSPRSPATLAIDS